MYTPIKGSWERIDPLEVNVDPNIIKNVEKFAKEFDCGFPTNLNEVEDLSSSIDIIELEDQLPKLRADEERTRKLWIMEGDKLKNIYDELRRKHEAAEEEAEAAQTEEEEA